MGGMRGLSMLRRLLLLAPKARKVGKEGEQQEKGARDISWMLKIPRITKGITGSGDTNMREWDQEVENNEGVTETEPESELRIATGLADMLLDDEEEQPTLDDQETHSISKLESFTFDQVDGSRVPNPTLEMNDDILEIESKSEPDEEIRDIPRYAEEDSGISEKYHRGHSW
jgi:hypothetical protein